MYSPEEEAPLRRLASGVLTLVRDGISSHCKPDLSSVTSYASLIANPSLWRCWYSVRLQGMFFGMLHSAALFSSQSTNTGPQNRRAALVNNITNSDGVTTVLSLNLTQYRCVG
jgi:hypothetical protein